MNRTSESSHLQRYVYKGAGIELIVLVVAFYLVMRYTCTLEILPCNADFVVATYQLQERKTLQLRSCTRHACIVLHTPLPTKDMSFPSAHQPSLRTSKKVGAQV